MVDSALERFDGVEGPCSESQQSILELKEGNQLASRPTIHLVEIHSAGAVGKTPSGELLDRARQYIDQVSEISKAVDIETALLGSDEYVDSAVAAATLVEEYAREHDIDLILVDSLYSIDATDPSLQPVVPPLREAGLDVEVIPARKSRFRVSKGELVRGSAVFVLGFVFYLLLGDPTSAFDLGTGAGVALLAALFFRNVTFEFTPNLLDASFGVVRSILFVPYLLWEIAIANVQFAYVVLHPSLPIDPRIDRIDAAVEEGLSVTTFANSLTLTPGTLTVDTSGSKLLVHSLTENTREDLLAGGRERAIRFLFYGWRVADHPGPRERGESELVAGPESEDCQGHVTTDEADSVEQGGDDDE